MAFTFRYKGLNGVRLSDVSGELIPEEGAGTRKTGVLFSESIMHEVEIRINYVRMV